MKNTFSPKLLRNNLMKDLKKEIKQINESIDNKLLSIQDDYLNIVSSTDTLYQDLCVINSELMGLMNNNNINYYNNSFLNDYIDRLLEINDSIKTLKEDDLINNLFDKKLKNLIAEDLAHIKCLELHVKSFDKKAALLSGTVGIFNIIKKVNDFCNYILNDFQENYEQKIRDMELHILDTTIPNLESALITPLDTPVINPINKNISGSIPKELKRKKLTFNELSQIAIDNNFVCVRHNGDHDIFKNIYDNRIVVIPYKANSTAPIGTQNSILSMIFCTPRSQIIA